LLLNVLLHSEFHIQNISNIQKYQAPVNVLVSNIFFSIVRSYLLSNAPNPVSHLDVCLAFFLCIFVSMNFFFMSGMFMIMRAMFTFMLMIVHIGFPLVRMFVFMHMLVFMIMLVEMLMAVFFILIRMLVVVLMRVHMGMQMFVFMFSLHNKFSFS